MKRFLNHQLTFKTFMPKLSPHILITLFIAKQIILLLQFNRNPIDRFNPI